MRDRIIGLALLGICAWGQTTGTVEGSVLDPGERGVDRATVELTSEETGERRRLETSMAGLFSAPGLAPGRYTLTVSAAGFRTERRSGVALAASQTVRIPVRLELGPTQQTVEVRAEATMLTASASTWGLSLSKDKLQTLPLNGRDLFELAQQQPGVIMPPAASKSALTYGQGQRFSVNGARPNQNAIRIDGIYSGDSTGNAPASAALRTLGVEAIEEIALVTSPFSAEYGRMAGGLMTAVSKSGTNNWHGSAYEYLRNSALDAKNYFDAREEKIPPFRRNQFGGLLGGPIRTNRAFFLVNYEAIREGGARSQTVTVPNANARLGILPAAGGGTTQVAVAPAVRPYLALYPLPNGRDFGDGTGSFTSAPATATVENYGSAKVDWLQSERIRTSVRYVGDGAESSTPDPFELWQFGYRSRYHILHFDTQWVQSARTVHQLRLGLSRVWNFSFADSGAIAPSLRFVPDKEMGTIQVTGLVELGTARARTSPQRFTNSDGQLSYQISMQRGAHQIKAGGGMHWLQNPRQNGSQEMGTYAFESLTQFLQGRPRSGDVVVPGSDTTLLLRQDVYHLFLQYDYRANRHLSWGAGARYEPYSALRDQKSRVARLALPIETARIHSGAEMYRNPSRGNLMPRAGLAWDPAGDGKTAIRLGGGIFTEVLGPSTLSGVRGMGGATFRRTTMQNPPFPDLLRLASLDTALPTLDTIDYEAVQPYVLQFQVAVQRQFGKRNLFHAAYIRTRGVHLAGFAGSVNPARPVRDTNGELFFPAGAARLNPQLDRISLTRTQFDLSHHGLVTSFEQRLTRGLTVQARYSWARTIDNSSTGVLRDYVATDFLPNPFDYRMNRGLSDYHLGHVAGLNFHWALPGRGRWLGGWELSGVGQWQTGSPFNARTGFDRTRLLASGATGDLGQRPDVAGAVTITGTPDRYFDPAAFALPRAGYYGNAGRNTMIGPGLANMDGSLQRRIRVSERHSLIVRGEVFNAGNRPNFQLPSALSLFASTGQRVGSAGRITETVTTSRQIQLALRWAF